LGLVITCGVIAAGLDLDIIERLLAHARPAARLPER
jgi:hypothetical protein